MQLKRSDIAEAGGELAGLPDDELVTRFKAGRDNRYFQELFDRHWHSMLRISRSILKETAAAEDAVQSTFERAFREIDRFDRSRNPRGFRAWLVRICRNICLDELRKRRVRSLLLPAVEISGNSEGGATGKWVMIQEAFDVLNNLEEQYRTCYLLKIEGYSYEEIASLTGYSAKEVKTFNRTARRNLTKAFERSQV